VQQVLRADPFEGNIFIFRPEQATLAPASSPISAAPSQGWIVCERAPLLV
jgi:hypothetical protein